LTKNITNWFGKNHHRRPMPVEAVDAGDFPAGDGFSEPREAGGVMFARHGQMVQMKRDGAAMDQFAPAAQMIKPGADVGILARAQPV